MRRETETATDIDRYRDRETVTERETDRERETYRETGGEEVCVCVCVCASVWSEVEALEYMSDGHCRGVDIQQVQGE